MRLVPSVRRVTIILSVAVMAEVAPMELTLQMAEPVECQAEVAVVPQYALILLGGALVAQAQEAKSVCGHIR